MKKFLLCWVLLGIFQLPYFAEAQTTYTPNLNLALPPAAPGTWGEQYNNNFSTLDTVTGHPAHVLQDEGVSLPARSKLNFLGTGITATDNSGADSTDVTISITGAGHQIKDEGGTTLTQRPIMNFTGGGVTCTDNSGQNATVCDIPAGSVNVASAFAWTGANSWLSNSWSLFDTATPSKILKFDISGFTASTTRTIVLPNASTRLLGDSDFSTTGLMARIASNSYAGVSILGTTNRISVTNGNGVTGNPTLNLGSLAVQTDQSNTFSTGDQDLGAAASFTFPKAAGATPTLDGRCAMDTTSHRLKCGFNGSTVTLAVLSEIQPLNANLTSLAAITGVNNAVPVFTGAGLMTSSLLPSCADSAGQHLNYDNTSRVFSCGTSSTGGLSGLTTNKYLLATGATSAATSGVLSESGGVLNVSGGIVGGSGPYAIFDTSAIASTDKTFSFINFGGTIRPSTGALTPGNMVTTNASGQFIDGGAAGTGTWTDSSTNTGTNKTLRDTLAGGTNTIYTPVRASWDAGSLTTDGTNCADPTKQTINSGPIIYSFSCADSNSSTFDGHLTLPITMAGNLATVKFRLTVNDVDSASQIFAGGFKAQCRASGTAPSSTWGTAQTVAITMVTANNDYSQTTAAVTADGTCSAGAELFWRFTVDATTNTDDGDARVIAVSMEQAS
jgi:hypothetical protein